MLLTKEYMILMIAEGMHKLSGADIACYCRLHATVWEEVKAKIKYYHGL